MYDLSIVCVYNKTEQFERFKASVLSLPFNVQLIALDNRNRTWSSAAAAYNYAVGAAQSEIILFSHQDIVFLDDAFVGEFINRVHENHDLLVGVAGAVQIEGGNCRKMLSGMYQGSKLWRHHTAEAPVIVSTLDECLFGCHKDLFSKVRFDEDTCDGWHFYAVDLSLQAQDVGAKVMVLPASVLHLSGGYRDDSYYLAQEKLKQKYAGSRNEIVTTCGWTKTHFVDPYRPIIDDELAALDRAGVPYCIRFFRTWDEAGDLRNKMFLPSLSSPVTGENVRMRYAGISLSDKGVALYSGIAVVRNFFSSKRWLFEDLCDLKRDYVKAVEEDIRESREFQIGFKLIPWWKVPGSLVLESKSAASSEGSFSDAMALFQYGGAEMPVSASEMETALEMGREYFASYVLAVLRSFETRLMGLDSSDLMVLEPLIRSALLHCEDACGSLCDLILADEATERHADIVRRVYVSSAPFRLGRLLFRLKRGFFH